MAHYQVKQGDSPASIARRFGIPMSTLISANPAKPTTVVANVRTWRALSAGEQVNVPGGGSLGDGFLGIAPAPMNATHKMISIANPGPHVADADVALWQSIIGVTADGLFGPNTQAATKAWQSAHGLSADGIVGPLTWAAAGAGPSAAAPALPSLPSILQQLPSILAPSAPAAPAPVPTVTPINVPSAAQALAAINPCDPANVMLVCAAQAALGVSADGKYGPATATALQRLVPGAPAGCSPRPSWWTPTGQSNCTGAAAAPLPPLPIPALPSLPASIPSLPSTPAPTASLPTPPPITLPTVTVAPGPGAAPLPIPSLPIPSSPGLPAPATQPAVTPPTSKGMSTAAVAGIVGVVAVAGIAALAVGSKSGKSRGGGTPHRARRASPARKRRK